MFSRPVSCPWNPVPTSSRLPTRPNNRASPDVGSVMRLSTLKSVLFPAPLRPMTPSTSPCRTSKLTSRSAQSDSSLRRERGWVSRWATSSPRVANCRRGPIWYSLESPRTEIARSLEDIREPPLHPPECECTDCQGHAAHHGRVGHRRPPGWRGAEERPPKRLEQPRQRIEQVHRLVGVRDLGGSIPDRA